MKKLLVAVVLAAATLAACAPIPNTSETIITRTLFDRSTIGGPQYPVVVRGAENVGVDPATLGQSLRFPVTLRGGSSFLAVADNRRIVNIAYLDVVPQGDVATATLTFLHGDRRIGVGRFTLARQQFSDPRVVGNASASLISSMLQEAREMRFDEDRGRSRCRHPRCL